MANINPYVTIRRDGHLAIITLSRSDSRNQINAAMSFDLADACVGAQQDDDVWAVMLTGDGSVFCGGTDEDALRAGLRDSGILDGLRVCESLASIDKPVVAALNGDAIDQGLEIALACDLRVASREASFGLTHLEKGLIPWDGGTQRLPRLIGRSRATEMILSSRILSAQEAVEIGLVNLVVEPQEVVSRATEIATTIASHGPAATRYVKEAVLKGLDMTLEQGMRLEADLSFLLQSASDRAEGLASFRERRPPIYRGE
ncbi:MAG: enoyl-CoA hydratase/isomerase family protein [Chloroflexi bacterium]|nr:enoyl-CoA hydratase/isomerase family protein [Chloroflexota bacterium]